jgi:uncharacterized protein
VARFNDGVEDIKDLQPGMSWRAPVSNVAQFGAFVDLGVHQDGLVHVSQLSNKFVNDAREVVKTGDIVKVKVLEVDLARSRISLTMRLDADAAPVARGRPPRRQRFRPTQRGERVLNARAANRRQRNGRGHSRSSRGEARARPSRAGGRGHSWGATPRAERRSYGRASAVDPVAGRDPSAGRRRA